MSGIAGITGEGNRDLVEEMLNVIAYRGRKERVLFETKAGAIGAVSSSGRSSCVIGAGKGVQDYQGDGHYARAWSADGNIIVDRDPMGIAPLYYGRIQGGRFCFASEVKALLGLTREVKELPPGCSFDGTALASHHVLAQKEVLNDSTEAIEEELRLRLAAAIRHSSQRNSIGVCLSGGVGSSCIAALVRPFVEKLHTFTVGLPGAPDFEYGQEVADFIGSEHHELVVSIEELAAVLPRVIYHMESFNPLQVRSGLMTYLAARFASNHVDEVFTGDGGDELFAGYEYLKELHGKVLSDELLDITRRLHNTTLQRVDRCMSAYGLSFHTCFLGPELVNYVMKIPVELKVRDGVGKWILRQTVKGMLPERVVYRKKSRLWEGNGIGELLNEMAEENIPRREFDRDRRLADGCTMGSVEELMYYRIFRGYFGETIDPNWVGRTKQICA